MRKVGTEEPALIVTKSQQNHHVVLVLKKLGIGAGVWQNPKLFQKLVLKAPLMIVPFWFFTMVTLSDIISIFWPLLDPVPIWSLKRCSWDEKLVSLVQLCAPKRTNLVKSDFDMSTQGKGAQSAQFSWCNVRHFAQSCTFCTTLHILLMFAQFCIFCTTLQILHTFADFAQLCKFCTHLYILSNFANFEQFCTFCTIFYIFVNFTFCLFFTFCTTFYICTTLHILHILAPFCTILPIWQFF